MISAIAHVLKVLNIKGEDDLLFERIELELKGIADAPKYLSFLEKHYNHIDLQYMSGYQKFLELTRRYKIGVSERMAKSHIESGRTRAKELSSKVRTARDAFEKSEHQRNVLGYTHKMLDFHNFVSFFSSEDMAILKTIGTLERCLDLQRSVSGVDVLEINIGEVLKAIAIRGVNTSNAISHKGKNVLNITKTVSRRF